MVLAVPRRRERHRWPLAVWSDAAVGHVPCPPKGMEVTADPSPLRRVLPFGHRSQNLRATRSSMVEPEVAVDRAARFMCMPLCTIPMEAMRGGPQVVDKKDRANTSRVLVAIDQSFREQSVTPKAEHGASSRLSADEFWPAPSEQSLPGAHSDTSAVVRSNRHGGRLVGWHVGWPCQTLAGIDLHDQ